MAEQKPPDLFAKLADRGEDVVGRITELPAAQRVLEAANTVRDRADELQRRLRGLDELEKRVAALEKKVERLSKPSRAKRPAAKRAATSAVSKKS
jgi:uncharacterized small protein (DUF1192 family)